MSTRTISPMRQRMIDDMTARQLGPRTQQGYFGSCKRFAVLRCSLRCATSAMVVFRQTHIFAAKSDEANQGAAFVCLEGEIGSCVRSGSICTEPSYGFSNPIGGYMHGRIKLTHGIDT